MPQYSFTPAPLSWAPELQERLGNHFVLAIAPPGEKSTLSLQTWWALFYPEVRNHSTIIGREIDRKLGGVESFPHHRKVWFSVRDLFGESMQIDISVDAKDIVVSDLLPQTWVRFGYRPIMDVFETTPPNLHQLLYSEVRRLKAATFTRRPNVRACYDILTTTLKAVVAARK